MKNAIIVILALVIVGGIGYAIYKGRTAKTAITAKPPMPPTSAGK